MFTKIKQYIKNKYQEDFDTLKVNTALTLRHNNNNFLTIDKLSSVEFKVFSQFGDDGIISWIIDNINCKKKIKFIEIGCANYEECNSKFQLLTKGVSVDGYDYNLLDIKKIKKSYIYQKYDLNVFNKKISVDYIKNTFNLYYKDKKDEYEFALSIDIDGNDYWILKNIDIDNLKPLFIIAEFNSIFGFKDMVTTPYQENFNRNIFSVSGCIYGGSLEAFKNLLKVKNYIFLGTNSAGNNAFFVRNDLNISSKIKQIIHYKSSFDECLKLTNFEKSKTDALIQDDLQNIALVKL